MGHIPITEAFFFVTNTGSGSESAWSH